MRLSASGLVCIRGNREVFSGLDFCVCAGELLAVRGPNGAGKTSLLRIVAGLLRPAAGTIAATGMDVEMTVPEQAHYFGHRDALKPSLTVAENLSFWVRYLAAAPVGADTPAPGEALRLVGLEPLADLPAGFLSAGQRRRLGLARLLATPRPIWLLDEPTSALDAAGQAFLADVMGRHLAGHGLIVAATHGPLGLEPTRELTLQ
jgi:heme exporter protein A